MLFTHLIKKNNSMHFSNFFKKIGFLMSSNYIFYNYLFITDYSAKNFFFFKFNFYLIKNFKNFFNALYSALNTNGKFIFLDDNEKSSYFYNLMYSEYTLTTYSDFFNFTYKDFKNQKIFFIYSMFLTKNKVKFVVVCDYLNYFHYLNYFNFLNMYIFSLIPVNYNNSYSDFFLICFNNALNVYKNVFYSYISSLYNISYQNKIDSFKGKYLINFNKIK